MSSVEQLCLSWEGEKTRQYLRVTPPPSGHYFGFQIIQHFLMVMLHPGISQECCFPPVCMMSIDVQIFWVEMT